MSFKVRFGSDGTDIKPPTGTTIGSKDSVDVNVANTSPIPVSATLVPPINDAGDNVQSTVSTVKTETAPADAVGFILMAMDGNTNNIRWSVGAAASAVSGQQLQPGRDTGYVPLAADISLCAESGTEGYNLQWVLST